MSWLGPALSKPWITNQTDRTLIDEAVRVGLLSLKENQEIRTRHAAHDFRMTALYARLAVELSAPSARAVQDRLHTLELLDQVYFDDAQHRWISGPRPLTTA